jgi:ribosomal protein L37AE/L43A
MRRQYHNATVVVREGSVCPACGRARIIRGELGLYCARCGWWPGWRLRR